MTTQERAAIDILATIAATIRSLGSVPSGHLYARVMCHMTIDQYNQIIATLVKAKMISNAGHLLTWIHAA